MNWLVTIQLICSQFSGYKTKPDCESKLKECLAWSLEQEYSIKHKVDKDTVATMFMTDPKSIKKVCKY